MLLCAAACGPRAEPDAAYSGSAAESGPAAPARDARPRVVCLGDSLTAGLGLPPEEAYPALLQQRVTAAGYPHEVANAGVSGDTSAGGLRRLDWSVDEDTRVLVVALGANDGLRGLPVPELQRNLGDIVRRAQGEGVSVLLAGMEAPPNFGQAYVREFRQAYADLARSTGVSFVPFLLDGVAGVESRLTWRFDDVDIQPAPEGEPVPGAASLTARERPAAMHR